MDKRIARAFLQTATIERMQEGARSLAAEKGITIQAARGVVRLTVAEALLALGMEKEASDWLRLAGAQNLADLRCKVAAAIA